MAAVSGYTIPEIRRVLELIRQSWLEREKKSFLMFEKVSTEDSVWSFSTKFVVAHYLKRKKRRQGRQGKSQNRMVTRSQAKHKKR